jgi:hypothetical protein
MSYSLSIFAMYLTVMSYDRTCVVWPEAGTYSDV